MIIFIDDEKWGIEGYLDRFDQKKIKDSRYENKHYFKPKDAWPFLKANAGKIDLIILDIALDYGDGNILNELDGGIQFLKEIVNDGHYKETPILIYTIRPKDKIERDSGLIIDRGKNIEYLNRDSKDEEFYQRVERILSKRC